MQEDKPLLNISKEYLKSINRNMKTNQDKANSIKNGQRSLNWSVLTVSTLESLTPLIMHKFERVD
jgi:hypothetical protein